MTGIPNSSRSGKAAEAEDAMLSAAAAAGTWEQGQDDMHAAYPFASVGGLEDTYRLNRWNQCNPISGDATLKKAFHLLY